MIKLKQTGDMEPKCPKCGHENAMLNSHDPGGLKCRDCGFLAPDGQFEVNPPEDAHLIPLTPAPRVQKRTDTKDAGRALRAAGIRYDRAFTDKRKTTGPRTKFFNVSDHHYGWHVISAQFPDSRVAVVESRGGVQSIVVWR